MARVIPLIGGNFGLLSLALLLYILPALRSVTSSEAKASSSAACSLARFAVCGIEFNVFVTFSTKMSESC